METLSYQPWQKGAAWGRFWALLFLVGLFLWLAQLVGPLVLIPGLFAALYLYATALGPLFRSSLQVVLEPEGIRVGGRLYLRERFTGVEGPLGRWTWLEERPRAWQPYRLRLGLRFTTAPLFYLVFGQERVPLWLDLPGWDRLLAHLGLEWREHPGLRAYLHSARGLAWLNGLLYPPAELEAPWLEARERYRRVAAWAWAGGGLLVGAFLVLSLMANTLATPWWLGLVVVLLLAGFALLLYAFFTAFNVGRGKPGWAVVYSPLTKGI